MKPQDFDRLSAYIDNQLAPAEKAALEAQMARDADLRAALQELRLTVQALRSLPPVKPPRNFTLSEAQAGPARPRRAPLFSGLRLAAALSAMTLVLVVAGDLAGSRGLLGAAAPAASGGATLTSQSLTSEAPAMAPVPVTPTPEDTFAAESEAALAPTETAEPSLGAGSADTSSATPDVAAMAAVAPTPTETPGAARQVELTPTQVAKALEASATPAPYDQAPPAATAEQTANYAAQPQAPGPGLPPLRLFEAALAMLTVMFGLGAWFARRNA